MEQGVSLPSGHWDQWVLRSHKGPWICAVHWSLGRTPCFAWIMLDLLAFSIEGVACSSSRGTALGDNLVTQLQLGCSPSSFHWLFSLLARSPPQTHDGPLGGSRVPHAASTPMGLQVAQAS